jgi:pimeloyl-ACP methyl ester carboxylesterase
VFKAADGTAYRLDGPEDGPPLVLIHGLGLSSSLWQAHLPALCARYRVLNYDLYGHGQSRPAERPLSLSVFADQIARLLEDTALGPAHLIGFSIGWDDQSARRDGSSTFGAIFGYFEFSA